MNKTPQPPTIITDPNQADSYQYVIMGKSKAGHHINAGFSHNHWDIALHNYLFIANRWLASLNLDSLDSILLVSNDQLNNDAYIKALQLGIDASEVERKATHNAWIANLSQLCPDAWQAGNGYDSYREVTHIEQLTTNPYNHDMIMKYDGKTWGNHLITVTTELKQDFIYACGGFASGTLTSIWERTQQCADTYNDPIRTIVLSKQDNRHHMAVIKRLLNTRQRLKSADLKRLISPIGSTVSKQQKPPFNGQSGRTGIYSVLAVLIIALLCLPMQCAVAYTEPLSNQYSGQASRDLLAFFVPDNCLASQAKQTTSTAPIHYPACTKQQGSTVYDGVTSQNTKALGQICGAVSILTESEPRHLIPIETNQAYSVTLTQNNIGGSYHG